MILLDSRGSALALNLMAMAAFSLLAVAVYVGAKSQVNLVIYSMREAQAQAIAEAGLEDALHELYQDSSWRTGFTNKPFADGSYTVKLSSETLPTITATGYSKKIFPVIGSAVKTVSVKTQLKPGNCPYALMGSQSVSVDGVVNAYDPEVSLTPSATSFTFGGHVAANATVSASACSTTTYRINGNVTTGGGAPAANCLAGTITVTTQTLVAPTYACPGSCTTDLQVNSFTTTTLNAGTYLFKKIKIDHDGVLNVNTTTGSVKIYYNGNVTTGSNCQINNLSKIPSRLTISDTANGHTVDIGCSKPLHAYIEGSDSTFSITQEVYGHFCGKQVTVTSAGSVHYDGGGSLVHAGWALGSAGSWKESYKRQ